MSTWENWGAIPVPQPITEEVLDSLLAQLTAKDERWLRLNPHTPWFYEAGVRYQKEPPGQEKWLPIPAVLAQKWGDCEDLCCWRAGELRVRGDQYRNHRGILVRTPPENARAFWVDHRVEPTLKPGQYHIRVERADGRVEDPSAMLGMYGPVHVQQWGLGNTHGIQNGRGYR